MLGAFELVRHGAYSGTFIVLHKLHGSAVQAAATVAKVSKALEPLWPKPSAQSSGALRCHVAAHAVFP